MQGMFVLYFWRGKKYFRLLLRFINLKFYLKIDVVVKNDSVIAYYIFLPLITKKKKKMI